MTEALTDAQREFLECLPATTAEVVDELGIKRTSVKDRRDGVRDKGVELDFDQSTHVWSIAGDDVDTQGDDTPALPDLEDVDAKGDPDESELTDRERYVARELQTGATVESLADDLDERESIVVEYLRDLKRQGWEVYVDETAEHVAIEGDHTLRSSEHKGTRTRKANRWWESRHNALARRFKALDDPTAELEATPGREDWVTHLTDLHAGDYVRQDDGEVVYKTAIVPDVIDYTTEQSIYLAEKHGAEYDVAHLLWGGDMVTNEGIYEGQFEDLDSWLDEQVDVLHDPLLRQVKAFSNRFDTVNIVCQAGNHGDMRASGTSKQANADLLVFKSIRNTVAAFQREYDDLQNVNFAIGQARGYRNFPMRGGQLTGHLRHGEDRDPQASTSARLKEWMSTLLEHDYDIAYLGHHHVTGMIPWDGPPIVATGSPKPSGEFVERLGVGVPSRYQSIATVHGVSDDGITGFYPVDDRKFEPS
ncbi:hypothetical protein [Halolamina rubra]|uniref:hypothetical protein n=1 Tax=Halolamina rubra TaxID=1380430 RepID=UPI00067879D2|nr:hypothetical protein [Halolamina rubra]